MPWSEVIKTQPRLRICFQPFQKFQPQFCQWPRTLLKLSWASTRSKQAGSSVEKPLPVCRAHVGRPCVWFSRLQEQTRAHSKPRCPRLTAYIRSFSNNGCNQSWQHTPAILEAEARRSGVQGQPLLRHKFGTSLCYIRHYLNNNNNNHQNEKKIAEYL